MNEEKIMDQVTARLDKIDEKLDQIHTLQLQNATMDLRISHIEDELNEMKSSKKAWVNPTISSIISAVMAFIVAGGLKIIG